MKVDNKKILVLGLGRSGISSIKSLSSLNASVYCYDDKKREDLLDSFEKLKNFKYNFIKNYKEYDFDFVVKKSRNKTY